MNTNEYGQTLRLHLLDMARVTQRGVDYAIKAYTLGNTEFCANVRDDSHEIKILHREITEIAQELLLAELSWRSSLRFIFSSERICNALQAVHSHAVEIAANSMRLLENGRKNGYADLTTMGKIVNSLMRLCVVGLFEEEIEHAEAVLRAGEIERLFETTFYDWYRDLDHGTRTQLCYELEITNHLGHIAHQAHEIAVAIVFWLKVSDLRSCSQASRKQSVLYDPSDDPSAESGNQKASFDGMNSFLQNVDTCFADASFWNRMSDPH
jgi:phosphate uptake regulator